MIYFDKNKSVLIYSSKWERNIKNFYCNSNSSDIEQYTHLEWLFFNEYRMQFNKSFGDL